jgi:hypothetical protein
VNRSDALDSLAAGLAKAQAQIAPATKDATNPHFRSNYATLASIWAVCRAPLTASGLSVVQSIESDDAGPILSTLLLHTSGQWVESRTPLVCDMKNMQSMGSAISYARRYALAAIVGVVTEDDDDGNAAVSGAQQRHAEPPTRPASGPARQAMSGTPRPQQGNSGPPRTGKALYGWANENNKIPAVLSWGKKHGKPDRILDWSPEDVAEVWGRINAPAPAPASPADRQEDDDDAPPF